MYVCMYMYMYTYTHIYVHTHIYIHAYIQTYITYIDTHSHKHIYIYTKKLFQVSMYVIGSAYIAYHLDERRKQLVCLICKVSSRIIPLLGGRKIRHGGESIRHDSKHTESAVRSETCEAPTEGPAHTQFA
jgi:hypothetical protein